MYEIPKACNITFAKPSTFHLTSIRLEVATRKIVKMLDADALRMATVMVIDMLQGT